jgi:hypothetical protein
VPTEQAFALRFVGLSGGGGLRDHVKVRQTGGLEGELFRVSESRMIGPVVESDARRERESQAWLRNEARASGARVGPRPLLAV